MFKWYGFLGIILIILVEINFFLKVEPFASWYFPVIWLGYILIIDSLVYTLKNNSLASNRFLQLLGMFVISALFWYIFEFFNLSLGNWTYSGTGNISESGIFNKNLFGTLAFSTILPALFETVELFRSVHLFDKYKIKKKYKISKKFLYVMISFGIACFFLPLLFPYFLFPLVWLGFFLILDPINYINNQPSIIGHIKNRNLTVPLSLLSSGLLLGILWEFWNYWAVPKWTYEIPYVGFLKIFEMPVLDYLGYLPFSLELYSMYWFVRSLFLKKENLIK